VNSNADDVYLFDFGGVVARFTPEHRSEYLSEHTGLSRKEIDLRLFESGLDGDAELGLIDLREILDVVRNELDNRISERELIDGWSRAFELNELLLERIALLPQRVALFSNNGPMLVHCCKFAPLDRINTVFSERIWSWELQAAKPTPVAFERAAGLLNVKSENLILFDDNRTCVEQARLLGWRDEFVRDPGKLFAA
jgi:HAD superfamily hydrolase (TIGR01509 family)